MRHLYLQARLEPTRAEPLSGPTSKGRLLALPRNIRLVDNEETVHNTIAYYDTQLIVGLKLCWRKIKFQS
jgi:hypothetical protein